MADEQTQEFDRFMIVLDTIVYGMQPAWCPNHQGSTVEECYEPFIYADRNAAQAEIDDTFEMQKDAREDDEDGDEDDEDDDYEEEPEDYIVACRVEPDGRVVTEFGEMSVEHIFGSHGVEIPAFLKPSLKH